MRIDGKIIVVELSVAPVRREGNTRSSVHSAPKIHIQVSVAESGRGKKKGKEKREKNRAAFATLHFDFGIVANRTEVQDGKWQLTNGFVLENALKCSILIELH